MDDPDRTVVWRRPGAAAETTRTTTETVSNGRIVEPVREQGSVVNVNANRGPGRVHVAPTATQLAVWRAQRVIYYIFGVIEAFIAIRFILKLLNANPESPFTQIIYNISWVFVFPFNNVVPSFTSGGAVFEWFSVIALIVYALVSVGLAKLIELIL